jgi:tetratricopeptide (TPR) repeat protein
MTTRPLALAVALMLTAAVVARPKARPAIPQADRLCQRGYDLTYNLDFPDALATFQDAIAAQPKDPQTYRGIATTVWLHILFQRGVVTVDDYVGHVTTGDQQLDQPPPAEANRFRTSIDRALALAEDEVRRNPRSASAHCGVGTAVGLTATYSATVEGRVLGGLRAARRAYNEQEQVLALDPRRKDAGLIVGTYRYIVASLPLPVRLMAYVVGFGGGRERGLQMIEEAAAYPGESQVDAKFALVLLYNRERRFDEALRVIRDLQARFPRNRLLWLEAGATALRAGRAAEAEAELNAGLDRLEHDARPRSFGEDALWRYKRGAARVLLGNQAGARADLEAALAGKGRDWVRGRAHTELGKLADLAGNRGRALGEYRAAVGLGEKNNDPIGVEEAEALIRTPYRKR